MKEIASALVKAQRQFGPALKSSNNPHFRSKYADLAACVEAVIDGLNSNGIALLQPTHECADGVIVETLFVHESGETMSAGKLHVPAVKNDPQGYGSALTYARRYSLMAACGIAPEDDDGNAASKNASAARQPARAPANAGPELLTKEEIVTINALIQEVGADIKSILTFYKVGSLNFIPRARYDQIVRSLEKKRTDAPAAADA